MKDEGASGDGFRRVPNIGLEEDVFGSAELLDAEVVVVDKALEKIGIYRLGAHFDTAAHTVEGHRDDLRPLRPTDRPVLGVVDDRPNVSHSYQLRVHRLMHRTLYCKDTQKFRTRRQNE